MQEMDDSQNIQKNFFLDMFQENSSIYSTRIEVKVLKEIKDDISFLYCQKWLDFGVKINKRYKKKSIGETDDETINFKSIFHFQNT